MAIQTQVDDESGSRDEGPHAINAAINLAHVACAYGELAILRWALQIQPAIAVALDPKGQLAIHVCISESMDPRLIEALLEPGVVSDGDCERQLATEDSNGMTPARLLAAKRNTRTKLTSELGRKEIALLDESLVVVQKATRSLLRRQKRKGEEGSRSSIGRNVGEF
jgi:hypothetical protein